MAVQYSGQITFGFWGLQELLDPKHNLIKLAEQINWEDIHDQLRSYYSNAGRRGHCIRLMVGLHILKHMYNISDDDCADRLRSDLYWMYFCGIEPNMLKDKHFILDGATMTKFRNRIGEKGFQIIQDLVIGLLIEKKVVNTAVMTTDSTCQPKNIIYPTDSALLDRGRKLLLKSVQKLKSLGVTTDLKIRTFVRKSKKIILNTQKLCKDRQDRIQKGTLDLCSQAKHVLNKCQTLIKGLKPTARTKKVIHRLKQDCAVIQKVITQAKSRYKGIHIKNKIYSLKESSITVIRKGKGYCPNEYGSKVNLSVDNNGFVVSHEVYHQNHHDSQLLKPAIKNFEAKTGSSLKQINTDRGYNQKKKDSGFLKSIDKVCIPWNGKKKNPDSKKSWFRNGQKKRAQIEGVIGHLKQDHGMGLCRYHGIKGDKINASLAILAWNLTKYAKLV